MLTRICGRQTVLDFLPKNSIGAEIGVHTGDFSSKIINSANPKTLYLIDPWLYNKSQNYSSSLYGGNNVTQEIMDLRYSDVNKRFSKYIKSGAVKIIRGTSVDASNVIADESLDFVYIDGDHSYESVLQDIKIFHNKLKKGGLLIGDDYILGQWWGNGVVKAFAKSIYDFELKIEFVIDSQICCKK